jgi:hypothetical protein
MLPTLIIYGTVIAGGFTLLLWLPNAVLDFAADKLAEEYAYGDLPLHRYGNARDVLVEAHRQVPRA